MFGFGAFNNTRENLRPDGAHGPALQGKVDTNDQFQIFGAAQYTLWKQLYFKFVVSHASNHVEDFNKRHLHEHFAQRPLPHDAAVLIPNQAGSRASDAYENERRCSETSRAFRLLVRPRWALCCGCTDSLAMTGLFPRSLQLR